MVWATHLHTVDEYPMWLIFPGHISLQTGIFGYVIATENHNVLWVNSGKHHWCISYNHWFIMKTINLDGVNISCVASCPISAWVHVITWPNWIPMHWKTAFISLLAYHHTVLSGNNVAMLRLLNGFYGMTLRKRCFRGRWLTWSGLAPQMMTFSIDTQMRLSSTFRLIDVQIQQKLCVCLLFTTLSLAFSEKCMVGQDAAVYMFSIIQSRCFNALPVS